MTSLHYASSGGTPRARYDSRRGGGIGRKRIFPLHLGFQSTHSALDFLEL